MLKRTITKGRLSVTVDKEYIDIIEQIRGYASKSMFVNEFFKKFLDFQTAKEIFQGGKT